MKISTSCSIHCDYYYLTSIFSYISTEFVNENINVVIAMYFDQSFINNNILPIHFNILVLSGKKLKLNLILIFMKNTILFLEIIITMINLIIFEFSLYHVDI